MHTSSLCKTFVVCETPLWKHSALSKIFGQCTRLLLFKDDQLLSYATLQAGTVLPLFTVNNRASVESNSPADLSQPLTQQEMHSDRPDLHQAGHFPPYLGLTSSYLLSPLMLGRSRVKVSPESRTSPKCDHLILKQISTISENFITIETIVKHSHKTFTKTCRNRLNLWPKPGSAF